MREGTTTSIDGFGVRPFTRIFGDSLAAQLIDHFTINDEFEYTKADLERIFDGVIPKILANYLEYFVQDGILKKRGSNFKFNAENKRAKTLRDYMTATVTDNLDRAHADFIKDPTAYWKRQFPEFFEKASKAAKIDVHRKGNGREIILYDEKGMQLTDFSADDKTIAQVLEAIKQNKEQNTK